MQRRSFIAGSLTLTAASHLVPWEAYASTGRAAPLVVRGPERVGKGSVASHVSLLLPGRSMVLGRGKGANLRIAANPLTAEPAKGDLRISRRHLVIRLTHQGAVMVEDLGSGNGTHLEGRVLQPGKPLRVREGQRITVAGTLSFRATLLRDSRRVVGVRLDQDRAGISYVLAAGRVGLSADYGREVVSADATKLQLSVGIDGGGAVLRHGSVRRPLAFDAGDGISHGEAAFDAGDGVSVSPKSFDAGDGVSHARRYEIALPRGKVGVGRLDLDVARFVQDPNFGGHTFIGAPEL